MAAPPEQNYGWQSWPDDLSPAIADRIVNQVPGMTRDRVFSSTLTDEMHKRFPPADIFIPMFFPSFRVFQPSVSGGGIYTTVIESTLVTKVFIRLEADIENRSTKWLEDETNGVYKQTKLVATALQTWKGPIHVPSGLSRFTRPMRLLNFDIQTSGAGKDGRWGVCPMTWEVSFVASLGVDYTGLSL